MLSWPNCSLITRSQRIKKSDSSFARFYTGFRQFSSNFDVFIMMKIGLFGAGHLGKIHLKCWKGVEGAQVVGFYDPDQAVCEAVSKQFDIPFFASAEELVQSVDALDIVATTVEHGTCAELAIKHNKHFFVEKPLADSMEEANKILSAAAGTTLKAQVGHVERFNPAFLSLEGTELNPMFIEAHRLSSFNPRGTDVSVVLDLMIHDLDLILALVKSPLIDVKASGVSVVSNSPDIANARLEFANGCVANVTASRLSLKNMRMLRVFQSDAYIRMDFLEKKSEIVKLYGESDPNIPEMAKNMPLETPKGKKFIEIKQANPVESNAIQMELQLFVDAIKNDTEVPVTLEEGFRALELAFQIQEKIDRQKFELA